jgi:hypothetical protein
MSFIKFIRSFFVKKEVKPVVEESAPEIVAEPIVEIPEAVAEQIAGEAVIVTPKKKKPSKKKK